MGSIKFGPLQKGDKVALIAPARSVTREEMRPFLDWAASRELKVQEGKHLYGVWHQFSGTDMQRASDFMDAWADPEIKAVFCARGGYGTMRWLHLLSDAAWETPTPKALIGYSDITTLHLELNRRGYETLHGMMAINFYQTGEHTAENIRSLEDALFFNHIHYNVNDGHPLTLMHSKPFSGELVGGNLSLLYASLGTPEQPDTRGKILFIEDLDEYLYHIDRMITSLRRAGIFNELKGLIVGSMHDMKDNATPFGLVAEEIIREATADFDFPVIFNFPAGHGPKNYCIKLNAYTTFDGTFIKQ